MTDHGNQDRPISHRRDDQLERHEFVESLSRALVRDIRDSSGNLTGRQSTGFVVGLTGQWGAGKSSILNLLSLRLTSMSYVVVASFNPWLFRGRDELASAFFAEIRNALGSSSLDKLRGVRSALNGYWAAIDASAHAVAGVAAAHGVHGIKPAWAPVSAIIKKLIGKRGPDLLTERRELEARLQKANVALVVLIDDLDRVDDDDVKAVAQLVKAVGDIKGISYLVAYDPSRVMDALGRGNGAEREASGALYLEKIIQHPIPLRPLFEEDVKALLTDALRTSGAQIGEAASERDLAIFDYLVKSISTPREVKRLVGSFQVLEAAVRGEVAVFDVLAYSWILTKSPTLRDVLARDLDVVVHDPSEREMIARVSGRREERTVLTVLGPSAAPHRELLEILFPHFASDQPNAPPLSIAWRTNLLRLLYLGNPPGTFTRVQLEHLWGADDAASMRETLSGWRADGTLPQALDRLDDIMPELDQQGDEIFWKTLSSLLVREGDFDVRATTDRQLTETAAAMLMNLSERDAAAVPRAQKIVEVLIECGDLMIVPTVLRQHLFAYGLTRHGRARDGRNLFTMDEADGLYQRELPRYRQAVLDGTALRMLQNSEAIFAISNRRQWDDELRASLTAQLDSREAIASIATLTVPPGFGADRAVLDELFDADVVLAKLNEFRPTADWSFDVWVLESVRRFDKTLQGQGRDI